MLLFGSRKSNEMAALTFGAILTAPCRQRAAGCRRGVERKPSRHALESPKTEEGGAVGAEDVRLPVCHKSSGLLRAGLADHASSASTGTRKLASPSRHSSLLVSFSEEQTTDAAARLRPH